MNTQEWWLVYTTPHYESEWLLTHQEFQILQACQGHIATTTNTDIKRLAKVNMPAADIGKIMARLRAAKLIQYYHIETGRLASGSGRYQLFYTADPLSHEPIHTREAPLLPPL